MSIVATPIGNLGDMTFRAVQTLKSVNVIACEDTRTSRVLCQHYDIRTPLMAYHEHNSDAVLPAIIARLQAGEHVALISDAGTPLISDPGYRLVSKLAELEIQVIPLPGASSIIAALSVAGLPTDRFHYAGFLPSKQQARRAQMEMLREVDATIIVLESSHRLVASLRDACEIFGQRQAVIGRELTKRFEEINRATLGELLELYESRGQVKGEIVLMIAPPQPDEPQLGVALLLLEALMAHYPLKQACGLVADATGLNKRQLYQQGLQLKDDRGE